jgi:murein L,D-transpeptidase YcbB/YkuD
MRNWLWVMALLIAAAGIGPFSEVASAATDPAFTAQTRQAIVQALGDSDEFPDTLPEGLDDGALKAAALRYARTVTGQRLRPRAVDSDWAMGAPVRSLEAEFETHLAVGDLDAWLQSLPPKLARYRALAGWRCRYAQLVDSGGWTALPPGPSLSPGGPGAGVLALRLRLAVEGYTTKPVSAAEFFDPTLAQALRQFQLRHDLAADGVLGRATRDALNVTAEQRLMQIDANLERWRWAPALPADRIEVDAAGDEAVLYRANEASLRMRVITGDAKHRTPMFVSRVDGVLLNPPWNVPASIAEHELWPKEVSHPGYLAANHIRLVDGRLQQAPGAMNALGALKFEMPDPFAIYLHDTPAKAAFGRPDRHLSHGCIRLEMPRELAVALLSQQGWSREKLDAAILGGATQRVLLTQAMPVFVFYWTAAVDETGALVFKRDPYQWDDKLMQALAAAKMP